MGLGTNHVIVSEVQNFVPELWSDEVLASYKQNLVFANLVRKLNHRGKKGDTIRIPTPSRGSASSKAAETQVTLIQHGTDNGLVISIDQHKEYSRLIEDIVDVQALASLRKFYTDDAGYAISKDIDTSLIFDAAANSQGMSATLVNSGGNIDSTSTGFNAALTGDGSTVWDPTATTNAGNASDLSDLGIRRLIKKLDDVDAPMAGRVFVIPTVTKQDLLGVDRFSEYIATGEAGRGNSIRNGLVGDAYGVEFYVTTALPGVEDAAGSADQKLALFFQKDAQVLVEQMGVRSQSQYKQEYLATLFTADVIYGRKVLRGTSIIPVVVPSVATES